VRVALSDDGAVELGERFATFVQPGRTLDPAITRLTGIRDKDLAGAPQPEAAVASLAAFVGGWPLLGHNVAFDLAFLELSGFPRGAATLDTAELASILLPSTASYGLGPLAAVAGVDVAVAHRALDDALTCASLLPHLVRRARSLPPLVAEEASAYAPALGAPAAALFAAAAASAVREAWAEPPAPPPRRARPAGAVPAARDAFGPDGPLARAMGGFEDRPEQRSLAVAIEQVLETGGALVAEAGAGTGKTLAYALPALGRAAAGERVIVSTHTLTLQDQLVRKDLPDLQRALGTAVPVAVLKGRGNYLCPRRWQLFRAAAATGEEVRLLLKTLVWRADTATGDRAELNLPGADGALWPRVSADDESCTARRCAATRGGCYLERARAAAADAGVVVVNHALLLHDARAGNTILPDAPCVVVDEAHRLEEVATDAFGYRLEDSRLRRDLDRIARSTLVIGALRSGEPARTASAEGLRAEIAQAHERAAETFAALGAVLAGADRLRLTAGLRADEERWLPVELAAERLADGLGGVRIAGEGLASHGGDEDEAAEFASALTELTGAQLAIARGIHDARPGEIAWLEAASDSLGLFVAPAHVGGAIRRTLADRHRSVVLTSATLAVAGSLSFALERLGLAGHAEVLRVGSPFDYASQATLLVPTDIALPHEPAFTEEAAAVIADVASAIAGRTLVLFTARAALREVAERLRGLEETGIAVLAQDVDGSRRALLERFAAERAVLLGTQAFWEGVDLPGDVLRCVVIARLPFDVPDDPLVEGRAERYEDPFREYQLPQAALRLRQGVGRLIRTKADRGAIVILDRRIIARDYGPTLLASLPPARVVHAPSADLGTLVAEWCAR